MTTDLTVSHGQLVRKGKVGTSVFVKGFSVRTGSNSYFAGTWEELEALCEANLHDFEPGTGSVDNDVILVNVPPAGFFTAITEITDENREQVEVITTKRREGEAEYTTRILRGEKEPAARVQIVLYRADVLAQDSDRNTDSEWEIVSVNASPAYHVPMTPKTMERNEKHEAGGTQRTYTAEEWAEAIAFWESHVAIWED